MKIKRKVKNVVANRTPVKKSLPQNKKLGYGKYRFPCVDVVPADQYYSEIVHIEDTTTRSGNQAKAVYYNIAKFSDVYKKANHLFKNGEKLKILYIKQIYPLNSDPYRLFLESMYKALDLDYEDDIDLNDCIGQTEAISIGYTSPTGIGGIQQRYPYEDDGFVYLHEINNEVCSCSNEGIDLEYDEYGNVI